MKLSIIVLASGNSKRFESNKLLYKIDDKHMYLYTVEKLINLKSKSKYVDEIIFVTKYDEIIENLLDEDLKVIKNENSEFGISQSVKLGISNSNNNVYLFIVCDQPYIKERTLEDFIDNFFESDKNIGCVCFEGDLLNPTIFTEKYKKDLMGLNGDKGGKKIILNNLEDTFLFNVSDFHELKDIDYKDDLK